MAMRNLGTAGLALSITAIWLASGCGTGSAGDLAFGLINAAYLVAEALTTRQRSRFFKSHPGLALPADWLGCFYVFNAIALALMFFRAPVFADSVWGLTPISWGRIKLGGRRSRVAGSRHR